MRGFMAAMLLVLAPLPATASAFGELQALAQRFGSARTDVPTEIARSEVTPEELAVIERYSRGAIAVERLMGLELGRGHVLGLTGPTLDAVARVKGLQSYAHSYDRLGIELDAHHTRRYLDAIVQEGLFSAFLVPPRLKTFFPPDRPGTTHQEFSMMIARPALYMPNTFFVFGAYSVPVLDSFRR